MRCAWNLLELVHFLTRVQHHRHDEHERELVGTDEEEFPQRWDAPDIVGTLQGGIQHRQ